MKMPYSLITAVAMSFAIPLVAQATQQPPACSPGSQCSASGDLSLSGTVATRCALMVSALKEATALNISAGESNALVANITEQTNNLAGYKVTVRSINNGKLVNAVAPAQGVAYQLAYDGGALFAPTTAAKEVKNSGVLSAAANHISPVRVTIAPQPTVLAGTYTDTLTFELASL
jgi:spore coat protein U-like protein